MSVAPPLRWRKPTPPTRLHWYDRWNGRRCRGSRSTAAGGSTTLADRHPQASVDIVQPAGPPISAAACVASAAPRDWAWRPLKLRQVWGLHAVGGLTSTTVGPSARLPVAVVGAIEQRRNWSSPTTNFKQPAGAGPALGWAPRMPRRRCTARCRHRRRISGCAGLELGKRPTRPCRSAVTSRHHSHLGDRTYHRYCDIDSISAIRRWPTASNPAATAPAMPWRWARRAPLASGRQAPGRT